MEIFKARKFGTEVFGSYFLVQGFFGVLLEALGIFLGFDFCPHSITPVTWTRSTPLGVHYFPLKGNVWGLSLQDAYERNMNCQHIT